MVFAVSPVGLTIITVGVYTLSVITLVFFVYSVANRSNFGRSVTRTSALLPVTY